MAEQNAKRGGNRKIGRNKEKCAKYRALHVREKHKLKRVLRSSMMAEAKRYAALHNLSGYLVSLTAT